MKSQRGFTVPELMILVWIAVVAAGLVGWVMNIVTIVHTCCEPLTGMLVVRIVGIFIAPLGAVLGYF
jgi:hypothetical protein